MADQIFHNIIFRIKDVEDILALSSDSTMTFEHAYSIARFYYDF